jgi:flagellar biosynthetic protein FliO
MATARAACRLLALLTIGAGSVVARAADTFAFAAPTAAPSATTPVIGTLRVTLAMFLVLGAVLVAAWLTRRLRGAGGASAGGLEVLAQVSLGTRERAVLLRVAGRQVLIGVAPGNVRTLHVVDSSGDAAEAVASDAVATAGVEMSRPTFKSLLLKSLGK